MSRFSESAAQDYRDGQLNAHLRQQESDDSYWEECGDLRRELIGRREFMCEAQTEELGDDYYAASRNFESLAMGQLIQQAYERYADKQIEAATRSGFITRKAAIEQLLRNFK